MIRHFLKLAWRRKRGNALLIVEVFASFLVVFAVATTAIDAWQLGFPTTVVSDLTIAHAWGGHTVEENQRWSLDYIAAMAKSKIVRSEELMK